MATHIVPSAVVYEVLRGDNYDNWSAYMKSYMLAHDLWDIIEGTGEPPNEENGDAEFKAWRKRNAMALHAIQISCDPKLLSKIRKITSAKIAWETLASICDESLRGVKRGTELSSIPDVTEYSDADYKSKLKIFQVVGKTDEEIVHMWAGIEKSLQDNTFSEKNLRDLIYCALNLRGVVPGTYPLLEAPPPLDGYIYDQSPDETAILSYRVGKSLQILTQAGTSTPTSVEGTQSMARAMCYAYLPVIRLLAIFVCRGKF